MDCDNDSPGKVAGFRFRAGEDDLEEVAADPENDSQTESLPQILLARSKKLLNKDTSLSDSEDTSESVKITEWWKDCEEDMDEEKPIKESRGREATDIGPAEEAEEADEALPTVSDKPQCRESTSLIVTSILKFICNFSTAFSYALPFAAASYVLTSDWWRGALHGACLFALIRSVISGLLNYFAASPSEVQKGSFFIPDYEKLPPLRAAVDPHQKRSCFNVYNKNYDPETYSVRQTRTVCVELDGSTLILSNIKTKLSKKAHFSETDFQVYANSYTTYDLTRCSVMLLPHGLAQKRLFSKKYPITVLLGEGAVKSTGKREEEPYHAGWETLNKGTVVDELVTPALYLFARCDRDKEDWYRRLLAACSPADDDKDAVGNEETTEENLSIFDQYLLSMSEFADKGNSPKTSEADPTGTEWLNALVNRILFDVFRSPYWVKTIQDKLQRKLSLIKLPYYVEEMQITELDLGRNGPVIHRVSKPIVDERGLWFDLDLTHNSCVKVTIQTKLNLHKLQKGLDDKDEELANPEKGKSPLFDNEAEDSVESSSEDEESPSQPTAPLTETEMTPKSKRVKQSGFLRIVENVAQSRAFKHVAQTKVVQKVIANVSQTKLRLQVQLDGIVGTVAVNLPPPPSDRLWYGFRGMPKIWLTASPLVGEWSVTFSKVKNWIERKLIEEFQYLFVLPHMDHIITDPKYQPPVETAPDFQTDEPKFSSDFWKWSSSNSDANSISGFMNRRCFSEKCSLVNRDHDTNVVNQNYRHKRSRSF